MSIHLVAAAFFQTQEKISALQKQIKDLRTIEKEYRHEIQSYLNERGEKTLEVDDERTLELSDTMKKISMKKKDYREHVQNVLYENGVDGIEVIESLLNKTIDTIPDQKLIVIKAKK